jgi:uncharacterized protein YndB with AHSA1/START domain
VIAGILIGVAVVVAALLVLLAFRPNTFRVQRSALVNAPPEKVYAELDDFKRWPAWSPWEKKDPAMKRTFGALTSGKGATYAWEGNSEVGKGSMEITESLAPQRLALNLDFEKPFEAHNTVDFSLAPKGGGTEVTWAMQGPVPYFFRLVHLFMDMDRMVGKDFEAGLANLKAVAEK